MKLKKLFYFIALFFVFFMFDKAYALTGGLGYGTDTGGSAASCWSKGCIHTGYSGLRVTLVDKNGNMISGTHTVDFWNNVPSAKALSGTTYKSKYMNNKGGISLSIGSYSVSTSTNTGLVGGISYQNQHELVQAVLDKDLAKCKLSDPSTCKSELLSTLGLKDLTSLIAKKSDCVDKLKETYLLLEPIYYVNINANNIVITGTEYTYLIYYYYTVLGDKNTTWNLNGAAGYGNALVNMYLAKLDAGDSTKYTFNANGSKYHILTETAANRYSDYYDWVHTAAWGGGDSSHYPLGSSMHLVWFGGLTEDVCDDFCTEEDAEKDAEKGEFRDDCCEIEEYVNAYFEARGNEITKEEVEACCWETTEEAGKHDKKYCDIVEDHAGKDLCEEYCPPKKNKCDESKGKKDAESNSFDTSCCDDADYLKGYYGDKPFDFNTVCCATESNDHIKYYTYYFEKNKSRYNYSDVSSAKNDVDTKYCSPNKNVCENIKKEDCSDSSKVLNCCKESPDYVKSVCPDEFENLCNKPEPCQFTPYSSSNYCDVANCEGQVSADGKPANVSVFSDIDLQKTKYLAYDAKTGLDLNQTLALLSSYRDRSQFSSLIDINDSASFTSYVNSMKNNPSLNVKVPITYNGGQNPYCDLYCQEVAVVTLPDSYPGVNAGRYFKWSIAGKENTLVTQQIVKICAEDIKFDKFINEYYEWMMQIQKIVDKYSDSGKDIYQYNPEMTVDYALYSIATEKMEGNKKSILAYGDSYWVGDAMWGYPIPNYEHVYNDIYYQYCNMKYGLDNTYERNECLNKAEEMAMPNILNKIKDELSKNLNYNVESHFRQYLSCLDVGTDVTSLSSISAKQDLKVIPSLDEAAKNIIIGTSEKEPFNVSGPMNVAEGNPVVSNSVCMDKRDCLTSENTDESYFIYEPVVTGASGTVYAKQMTCDNANFVDTSLNATDDSKLKVPNFLSGRVSSYGDMPAVIDGLSVSVDSNSNSFVWNGYANRSLSQVAGRSDFAASIKLVVVSSSADYQLNDSNTGYCVCSDGSIEEFKDDNGTMYCPCDPEKTTTQTSSVSSPKEDCYLKFESSAGACKYAGSKEISQKNTVVVKYSANSGAYGLNISYSRIGSCQDDSCTATHFGDSKCGACSGGECKYEGTYCKLYVGNSLLQDEWTNTQTESWELYSSYYLCKDGECSVPPTCPDGDCATDTPTPECPDCNTTCVGEHCDNHPGDVVCSNGTCPTDTPKCDGGDCATANGLSLIYRTVDLDNMFPGREPGQNWQNVDNGFYKTVNKNGSYSFISRDADQTSSSSRLYTSDLQPLYHFELSPAAINEIRRYNSSTGYNFSDPNTIAYLGKDNDVPSGNVGIISDDKDRNGVADDYEGISQPLRTILAPIIELKRNEGSTNPVQMVGQSMDSCPTDKWGYEYCRLIFATYSRYMTGDRECWSGALACMKNMVG